MTASLYVLLFPILFTALFALLEGLFFGFNLWRTDRPLVTMVWLLIVASPVCFYGLLLWSKGSPRRTVAAFSITWAAIVTGVGEFLIH